MKYHLKVHWRSHEVNSMFRNKIECLFIWNTLLSPHYIGSHKVTTFLLLVTIVISTYLWVFLPPDIHLSICVPTSWYSSIYLCSYLLIFIYLSVFLSPDIHLSICVPTSWYPSIYVCSYLQISIYLSLFLSPDIHLSICVPSSWYLSICVPTPWYTLYL